MDDDIQLPPVPPVLGAPRMNLWIDDLRRAAVLADRERRAKQAQPAKPKVHSRTLRLTIDGTIYREHENVTAVAVVTLHWTDDGRAWIESERNRELARRLRQYPSMDYDERARIADALDGGER